MLLLATAAQGWLLGAQAPAPQSAPQPVAARSPPAEMMAKKISQRKKAVDDLVDKTKLYDPVEGIALMKKISNTKFIETAEIHGNLNLNPKFNDQQIRTTVALPHGTGKTVRVAVLAEGPAAEAAEAAGADKVGMSDLIEDISKGVLDFDVLLATPPAMPKLAKLGKVLGPKGLMPSPKAGTVTPNPGDAVGEFKAGKLEFRTDKQGVIHVPFGKLDFNEEDLQGNLAAVAQCIEKNRPSGCKGKLWISATLSSTMGPAIKLDLAALKAFTPA